MQVICTRLADEDRAWLDAAAQREGLKTSDIVRAAVKYYRLRAEEQSEQVRQ